MSGIKWNENELHNVKCDTCGSSDVAKSYNRKDGMHVIECRLCGSAYLNPRPKDEYIPRYYQEDYFTGVSADQGIGGLRPATQSVNSKPVIASQIQLLEKKVGSLQGKKILEIGCATGELLLQAKQLGAETHGLEISDYAASVAREKGLNVITGTTDDEPFENGSFDIVMCFEVIEHVISPQKFAKQLASLLKPGGFLLISTPNYACVYRYGEQWFGFQESFEHIYFFSLNALNKLFINAKMQFKYTESSKFIGGPIEHFGVIGRQIERIKTYAYFVSQIGFLNTIKAISMRSSPTYPFALGHEMIVLYQKSD